jgi:hypothetical protein
MGKTLFVIFIIPSFIFLAIDASDKKRNAFQAELPEHALDNAKHTKTGNESMESLKKLHQNIEALKLRTEQEIPQLTLENKQLQEENEQLKIKCFRQTQLFASTSGELTEILVKVKDPNILVNEILNLCSPAVRAVLERKIKDIETTHPVTKTNDNQTTAQNRDLVALEQKIQELELELVNRCRCIDALFEVIGCIRKPCISIEDIQRLLSPESNLLVQWPKVKDIFEKNINNVPNAVKLEQKIHTLKLTLARGNKCINELFGAIRNVKKPDTTIETIQPFFSTDTKNIINWDYIKKNILSSSK